MNPFISQSSQVKWAPKRRESYYLMSERVYNDRLMMKLRDEEASPMFFEFDHTEGDTDELHDLQKLIQSTSSHLKNMKLDTKFKDYTFEFDNQKQAGKESGTDTNGETGNEDVSSDASKAKRKVTFSDHVTLSDTDASFAGRRGRRGELDPSDIEINFSADDMEGNGTGDESRGISRFRRPGEEWSSGNHLSGGHSRNSSLEVLSTIRGSSRLSGDDYSSDFTGSSSDSRGDRDTESRLWGSGDELDMGKDRALRKKSRNKLHDNPHCQHSLARKTNDYYRKLPKLLRTSELREKLQKERLPKARELGRDADHSCMGAHKTAYDRALLLARYKTLPPSYSFLARKTTGRDFSYFARLPGAEKSIEFKGDAKPVTMEKKKPPPRAEGRRAIFGDIDMNDFYSEEDELIYFINPEELKQVVASSVSTDESSQSDEGLTATSATTSRTATTNKTASKFDSSATSGTED